MPDESRTVVVTGGTGFIGSHTVVKLIENGFRPLIVDDFSNSEPGVLDGLARICGHEIEYAKIDCGDRTAMYRVFEDNGPISGVIHFAASKAVGESQERPLHYYRNNVGSLITVLDVMNEFEVRDLVFSSSCVVYGEPAELPVTEQTPFLPAESVYGSTKQVCERVIQDVVRSGVPLRAALLRYFNPIGAHESAEIGELPIGKPKNLIPVMTQSAAGIRGPVRVFGGDWDTPDGSCVRDYIHVLDLAEAHLAALNWLETCPREGIANALNVGTGRGTSVLEAISAFQTATNQDLKWSMEARRPGDIGQIYASVEAANRILKWSAKRSIEDAMRDAWRWQMTLTKSNQ